MAIVYADNVIEIAVHMSIGGSIPTVNVWHYRAEEGVNTGDEDAVLDFANNWQDHIMGILTSEITLDRFEWHSLDQQDNNVGTLLPDPGKPTTGASSVTAVPPNVALLVHKVTANRPRGKRDGRAFIPGISEGNVTAAGLLIPAAVTQYDNALQAFYDGVTDDPIGSDVNRHLVVLETTPLSRTPGTHEVTLNARRVTELAVDPRVATQRDRLR